MPQRFPATTRNSTALKASGAAPNATINMTREEGNFLIACKEVVAPTPPANTVLPTITGTVAVAQTLSVATPGTWTGSNIVFEYQWQRSLDGGTTWIAIPEGGGNSYLIPASESGRKLRCRVTGRNASPPPVTVFTAATITVP